jgi:hypothetical protein
MVSIITNIVAAVATPAISMTGLSSRYGLTPQASSATDSRSADIRPSPIRRPTRRAIGIVRPSAWGPNNKMMWPTVCHGTPLATSFSISFIRGGSSRMNVKMRSARKNGGRISRIT